MRAAELLQYSHGQRLRFWLQMELCKRSMAVARSLDSEPFVTLHLPPERLARVQQALRGSGLSRISFDESRSAIHFGYSYEGAMMVVERFSLLEYASEGFEFHARRVDLFIQECETFFDRRVQNADLDSRLRRWLAIGHSFAPATERENIPPLEVHFEMLKLHFAEIAPPLLASLEESHALCSSHSLQELQALAGRATVTSSPVAIEMEHLDFSDSLDEACALHLEDLWDRHTETRRKLIVDDSGMGTLIRRLGKEGEYADLLQPAPPKERGPPPPPVITREIREDLLFERGVEGPGEVMLAYRWREGGALTGERFGEFCAMIGEGLSLFRAMLAPPPSLGVRTTYLSMGDPLRVKRDLFRRLLAAYPGVAVLESHTDSDSDQLLIEAMPVFAEMGVGAICYEGFEREIFQGQFDRYVSRRHRRMEGSLRRTLIRGELGNRKAIGRYTRLGVIQAAKRVGITILCGESSRSRQVPEHVRRMAPAQGKSADYYRICTMNYEHVQIVSAYQREHPGAKVVSCIGGGHGIRHQGVEGVASILGWPSIGAGKILKQGLEDGELGGEGSSIDYFFNPQPSDAEVVIKRPRSYKKAIGKIKGEIASLERLIAKTSKRARILKGQRRAVLSAKLRRLEAMESTQGRGNPSLGHQKE